MVSSNNDIVSPRAEHNELLSAKESDSRTLKKFKMGMIESATKPMSSKEYIDQLN